MNSFFDIIKKLGAYGLIALLVVIMGGYAFVDQNATDAAKNIFVSGSGPGKFGDQTISWSLFGYYYNQCKERQSRIESQFGEIDKSNPMFARFSAENCVKNTIGSLYALKDIGEELSLDISTESIKADIAKQAREAEAAQNVIHEDERLTAQEFYRRLFNQIPFEARKLQKNARYTQNLISHTMQIPDDIVLQKNLAKQISLNLSIVRWENATLLENLKSEISLSESQIKQQYEEEQKKLKESQKKSLQEEKPFLIERMKAEQARKKLGKIKQLLSDLKSGFKLSDVSRITGMPVQNITSVPLSELDRIRLAKGNMNLDSASFYNSLRLNSKSAYSTGPHQDSGFTVYVQVNGIQKSNTVKKSPIDEEKQKELSQKLWQEISNELLEESSKRGAMKLDMTSLENG